MPTIEYPEEEIELTPLEEKYNMKDQYEERNKVLNVYEYDGKFYVQSNWILKCLPPVLGLKNAHHVTFAECFKEGIEAEVAFWNRQHGLNITIEYHKMTDEQVELIEETNAKTRK